jgi:trk system potassium uptake protein TrkH
MAGGTFSLLDSVRDSMFQIVSIITTTGFSSADFALWSVAGQTILFTVMLVGGCAGSAGGGVKVIRVLFGFKYLKREITQIIHPQAILPIKIDNKSVADDIQRQILGFLLFYLVLMTCSALAVTIIEKDAAVGLVGTAATIGNIGPGFGEIGPMGSFGGLSVLTKIIFIINMIVGRLELIPFLAMLHPDFWSFRKSTG